VEVIGVAIHAVALFSGLEEILFLNQGHFRKKKASQPK
jgi:hypothetical protein